MHKPKEFVANVMPKHFRQTKLTSFQCQLNLCGFSRLTRGKDSGGHCHKLFLRGKQHLFQKMIRAKKKGTRFKAASSPKSEPDFCKMSPVLVTPHNSSNEEFSCGTEETQQAFAASAAPPQIQSFGPLPMSFVGQAPIAMDPRVCKTAASSIPHAACLNAMVNRVPDRSYMYVNKVLDQAVDDIFLQEALQGSDPIIEAAWDSTSFGGGTSLQDEQLGMLLEQLWDE